MIRGNSVAIDTLASFVDGSTSPLEIFVKIEQIAPIGANRVARRPGRAGQGACERLNFGNQMLISTYNTKSSSRETRVYVMLSAVTRAQKRAATARLEDNKSRMIKKAFCEVLEMWTGNRSQRTRRLPRPLSRMRPGASRLPQL